MNQAFIKAYRPDSVGAAPPAPAFISRPAVAAAELSTTLHVLAAGAAYSLSTHDLPASDAAPAPASSVVAPPPDLQPAHPQRLSDRPQLRVHPPSGAKRPLSSFTSHPDEPAPDLDFTGPALGQIAAEPPTVADPPPQSPAVLLPATSVAEFQWPDECKTLRQRCAAQLDRVADAVLAQANDGHPLVGVVGLRSGHGCTTTLLSVAAQLASRPRRVILVDAHFAAPRLAERLGVEPVVGWQFVLERGVPVAEAIVHSTADRLDLLPLGSFATYSPHLGGGLQPAATAQALREAYDLVLVDLGAILEPLTQATILELVRTMHIDAALLVTGPQPADPRELAFVAGLLGQRGCEPLGIVENRVPA